MSTSTHILPTDKDDEVGAGAGARARGEGGGWWGARGKGKEEEMYEAWVCGIGSGDKIKHRQSPNMSTGIM